jgi:hypothetical protein
MGLPVELQSDERLITRRRRHILFIACQMLKVVLAAAVPSVALLVVVEAVSGLDGNNGTVAGIVAAALEVIWLVLGYFTWYRYNRDAWVITNQRLIDSVKRHWFHHQISSADLIQIEDMSVNRSGILQAVFNCGVLCCQTVGTK